MKAFVTAVASIVLCVCSLGAAHASEKHLFYVHGCCVKDSGDPKARDYEAIVQKLKDSGFIVEYELRTADVGDNDAAVQAYAAQIAGKVNALLTRGTKPENITVAGYSLGSMTSMVASGLIANPNVNYVLLSGCPVRAGTPVTIDYSKIKGRLLSITDKNDDKFGSCNGRFPEGNAYKEIVIDSGKGHSGFRLAQDSFIALWLNPLLDWTGSK
jgi:hypothetical protein